MCDANTLKPRAQHQQIGQVGNGLGWGYLIDKKNSGTLSCFQERIPRSKLKKNEF